MQRTELLIDQGTWTLAQGLQIEAAIVDNLLNLLRLGVVLKQRNRTFPIREEIHRAAEPDRVRVVGVFARDFLQIECFHIDQPNLRSLAAAIVLPSWLPLAHRYVCQRTAVARKAAPIDAG